MKPPAALFVALLLLVTFAPVATAELDPAPDGSFTVAVIPDTQHFRGEGAKSQPDSENPLTNPNFQHPAGRAVAVRRRIAVVAGPSGEITRGIGSLNGEELRCQR